MLLLLFLLLLCKHAFVDIGIQSIHSSLRKSNYFSTRAQFHYCEHGIGTFIVCLGFTQQLYLSLAMGVFDYLTHWNIDFAKSSIVQKYKIKHYSIPWHFITSVDQMLHYITYGLIVLFVMYSM